ncbi:transglycosylase domain-containing protein [Paenibacillus piri]|uniref:PBP1A family penicillin-binding protein n=1 Tax=Paenibacillus piri TaxID=2547395 RepID=A0A4R5KUE9_9BACL|nr:PBP1A family penicillin-binding protein [Paenibacillus piri]TDF99553.1 PBP1A family penicillin-binding protein [Paenibacillus piri]
MATNKKTTAGKTKPKKKKQKFSVGKALMFAFVSAVLALICALGVYIFIIINGDKILKENIDKLDMDEASHVYDVNENEVAVLYRENREIVQPEDIPDKLKQAFIATEDKRFGEHSGIDFLGIGRALVKDIVARSAVEGGSTITQQLAKNVFLSSNKTFFRKATEMSIAVALENNYGKDDILTKYLNRIFFGNRVYGVKAAAKKYFGVSDLKKLELWQMATLAAIPKAPTAYNPISNPERSKERRSVVLKLMEEQKYITAEERAKADAVEYVPPKETAGSKDYLAFLDYVINEANDLYGMSEDDLLRNGYKIYTTMDANAQKLIEQTFANDKFFQKDGPEQKMQGAMAIINHKDGGLVGISGGRDYVVRGLNRATVMQQPGSSIKPILVYAPALESGKFTPYSMLEDKEANYNGYTPRNYDGVYRGQVNMFEAVKRSINAPAVWLLKENGLKYSMKFAENMGIPLDPVKDANLAISLGGMTNGATPVQMAAAYGAFANNGYLNTTHSIVKIINDQGTQVAAFKQERNAPVMSAKTAYYMTLLMQSVVEPGGTGAAAKFERPLAGKTGSTQNVIKGLEKYNRDLWFTGYTPEWSAAVWLGFDKPDAKHYVTMSSGAPAIIFKEVMQKALAKRTMTKFNKPDGVEDPVAPPKGVADLKAEYVKDSRAVIVNWTAAGEGVSYQVFRKEDKDKDFPAEPLLSTTVSEVRDITVTPGATYQYAVASVNPGSGASGGMSAAVTVSIPLDNGLPGTGQGEGQLPGQGQGQMPGQGQGQTPGQGQGQTPGQGQGQTPGQGQGQTPGQGQGQTPGQGQGLTPGQGQGQTPGQGQGQTPGQGQAPGQGQGQTPGQGQGQTPGQVQTSGQGQGQTPGGNRQPGGGSPGSATPGQGSGTTAPGTGGQPGTTAPGTSSPGGTSAAGTGSGSGGATAGTGGAAAGAGQSAGTGTPESAAKPGSGGR